MDIFREGCMDMFRGEIYGYVQRMDIWICTEEGYMDMYRGGIYGYVHGGIYGYAGK